MSYSSQIATIFSGPSSSTNPRHNGLAVGPNNIVMVEGSRIEWTNLSGGSPTLQSTYNFFSSLSPTGGLYDQRSPGDRVEPASIDFADQSDHCDTGLQIVRRRSASGSGAVGVHDARSVARSVYGGQILQRRGRRLPDLLDGLAASVAWR